MQRCCLFALQIYLRSSCYLFWCFMTLAAEIIFFKVTRTTQSICLIHIMETNKCSMSKTLRNVHHCMSRSTRHRKILDLRNVFCQRGSFCESVTLQSLRTADHDCVHFILVSCTLLMFRHGLMIQPQLSWAVELKHVSITKKNLEWYWWHLSLATLWKYFQMVLED